MHNDHACMYNSIFESRSSVNGSIPTGVFDSRLVFRSISTSSRAFTLPPSSRMRSNDARERRDEAFLDIDPLPPTRHDEYNRFPRVPEESKGGSTSWGEEESLWEERRFAESFPARDRRNSIVEAKMERRANNGGLNFYRMDSSGLGLEGRTIRERSCWITRALVG